MKILTFLFVFSISISLNAQSTLSPEKIRLLDEINDDSKGDSYPWLNESGLRLYYTKESPSGNKLVYCERKDHESDFDDPQLLPIDIVNPISSWLTTDELTIYVSNVKALFKASRLDFDNTFSEPKKIELEGLPEYMYITSPSLSVNEEVLFARIQFELGEAWELVKFSKSSELSFVFDRIVQFPEGVEPILGQVAKNGTGFLVDKSNAKDEKQVFYSKPEGDNWNTDFHVKAFDDFPFRYSQVSISGSGKWIVGVTNSNGYWDGNDLFIVSLDLPSSIPNEISYESVKIYPNPCQGQITISTEIDARIEIFNSIGQQVDSFIASSDLMPYNLEEKGVFIVRVFTSKGFKMQKVIVQ